nr:mechanosensitive ion channel family protein [Altericroceibacterium indicum]
MRVAAWIAAVLLGFSAVSAQAILPSVTTGGSEPAQAEAAPVQIETEYQSGKDEQIASRISGIFSEIPSLSGIVPEVREGVVTLSGTVSDPADRVRAEAIAARVSGVVTVENRVTRDVSVDKGQAFQSLSQRLTNLWHLGPLAGMAILVALIIGAIGYAIAAFRGFWERVTPNVFLSDLIRSAIRFIFVVGGVVVGLDMLGAGALLGAVLGGAGVVGIALGFAMRDTIENYVASLMLSLRQPFRANDHVLIEGMEGRVIRLTSRATILMTLDGNHLRIPNSTVFKAVILNYTRNPQRRFEFVLGIDANDSPDEARHLGVKILKSIDFILDTPEPSAVVEEVGDSNIVIRFMGWLDQEKTDFQKGRSRAIPAVKDALEDAGFALPEPIYRLRFDVGGNPSPELLASLSTSTAEGHKGTQARPKSTKEMPKASEITQDVVPENEVAQMVDRERANAPSESDLLDSRRPVE